MAVDTDLILGRGDIVKILPHRLDALLVDEVIGFDPEAKQAIAQLRITEAHCRGHFGPGQSVFPGHKWIEAIAQTGGLLAYLLKGSEPLGERMAMLYEVEHAKFHHAVEPNGKSIPVFITVTCTKLGELKLKFTGQVKLEDGTLVAEAKVVVAVLPPKKP